VIRREWRIERMLWLIARYGDWPAIIVAAAGIVAASPCPDHSAGGAVARAAATRDDRLRVGRRRRSVEAELARAAAALILGSLAALLVAGAGIEPATYGL
jgi:hypothetical protein